VALGGNKRALVIGQKSGMVHALDPDNQGEILWQTRVAQGGVLGGIQWGSASDGARMYVAIGDIRFAGRAPGGGPLVDPKQGGGLAALKLSTGEKAWTAKPPVCGDRPRCSPAQSAAVTAIPGVVFSGSLDGRIRGYSTDDGHVVWEFDTAREFDTLNGGKAKGGSIDGHGPVVAGGFVYTNSGYGSWGTMPGNVLLAFRVGGR
jgi:polyvinyl alcohol dehydrogenase (cytochrome)